MSADTALSILFECAPGSRFELEQLREAFGDELEPLLGSGLLAKAIPASEVLCTDCGDVHYVSVESHEGGLVRFCAEGGGWAEVLAEAVERYSFDQLAFLAELARKFGAIGKVEPLIEGVCWRLGKLSIDGREALLLAARELSDPSRLMETAAVLGRVRAERGLVFCGEHPGIDPGLFPKGFKLAALDDLVSLSEEGGIAVDLTAAEEALGLRRRGRGGHGATINHPHLKSFIQQRQASGLAFASETAEARRVLEDASHWASQGRGLPELDALRMAIRRQRRAMG